MVLQIHILKGIFKSSIQPFKVTLNAVKSQKKKKKGCFSLQTQCPFRVKYFGEQQLYPLLLDKMPGITVNTSLPNSSHKTPSIPMPIANGFSPSQLLISLSNPSSPHAQRLPLPHDSSPTKPQPLFHSGRSHLFKPQWLCCCCC